MVYNKNMKITKYEHSCLVVEEQGRLLVIDPGKFSTSFKPSNNIDCVVVTHVHSDHFDHDTLNAIKTLNPDVMICAVEQVAEQAQDLGVDVIDSGRSCSHGPFHTSFYGGDHELYEDFKNVAVMVNDTLYHPGDSYTVPNRDIPILAAPASAPWLRVTEASQFIKDCKPQKVIPIHNALLSEVGESIHYRILSEAAAEVGSEWTVLKSGQSLTV
jgi:L-ascorbate metabolism protein UlaG (beta-lactamase superfamily)